MRLAISIPRPKCDRLPVDPRQSPFVREPSGILTQKLPGIDPIAGKRQAAEAVNEQVVRHGELKPGQPGPLGAVVVIKEPNPKSLVEPADGVIGAACVVV